MEKTRKCSLQTITIVEISNHVFKWTKYYNVEMSNKRHSHRIRHIPTYAGPDKFTS